MDFSDHINSSRLFQIPEFVDAQFPREIRALPIIFYLYRIFDPKLIVDLEVETGNFYFAYCQSVQSSQSKARCIGFISDLDGSSLETTEHEKLNLIKQHNVKEYNEFSSILTIPTHHGLTFIEDQSIDLLSIGCKNAEFYLNNWEKKINPNGIILLRDLEKNFSAWEKLKQKYFTIEFREGQWLDFGIIFKNRPDEIKRLESFKFLTSQLGQQIFFFLGQCILEIHYSKNIDISQIKAKKLNILVTELRSTFKAHLNSWRWKIGNKLVRFIEKILLRKKVKLASDSIGEIIDELSAFKHQNIDSNKEEIKAFIRKTILCKNLLPKSEKIIIGFAVSSAGPTTKAGDYFTALELGKACEDEFDWLPIFLAEEENWYDLEKVDILITMKHTYELEKICNAKPHLIRIAWIRNRVDEWLSSGYLRLYDLILCSSKMIYQILRAKEIESVFFFPIATNPTRFLAGKFQQNLSSDYCFTGNFWGEQREIEKLLIPGEIEGKFQIFGQGWKNHKLFGKYWKGAVPYLRIPDIYASTRLVIDDATVYTESWASVNSRVFDVLGSGKLVITNGKSGVRQLFENEIPIYSSQIELTQKINYYLNNEKERNDLVKKLQAEVLSKHTYQIRAGQLKKNIISRFDCEKVNIAIKVPVPNYLEAENWGDYHFAIGLKKALLKLNLNVRIDCIPDWYNQPYLDDVVITLKGLSSYKPQTCHINLLWIISHPEKVSIPELDQYHHIFVASTTFPDQIAKRTRTPVSSLLQCTDPEVFKPDSSQVSSIPKHEYLFIGNSRAKKRPVIQNAIDLGLPIAVYGKGWDNLIPNKLIKGIYIPNDCLYKFYSRANFIFNDHWESMKSNGFISNRIFDIGACGKSVITDQVYGLKKIFPENTLTIFKSQRDLQQKLMEIEDEPLLMEEKGTLLRKVILENHTFDHRAQSILEVIKSSITN